MKEAEAGRPGLLPKRSCGLQGAVGLICAMCLAEVLSMVGIFAFPALAPRFISQWELSNTQAGWINGIYFAGYTLAVPVLAGLTDRVDPRRIYLIFASVGALAAVCFAVFAQGFWTALACRALAGLGLAGTFIPGLKALVDRLQEKAQSRAISFYTASFSLGTSLSFFLSGWLAGRIGWRRAFASAALGCLFSLALAAVVLKPKPYAAVPRQTEHFLDFRPVLRNRKAMAYILAYAAHTWELFAVRSWMVVFLAFNLSLQAPGNGYWTPSTVVALAALVAMWASVGGAELALKFGRKRVLYLIMGASAVVACGIGYAAALPYPVLAALCVFYMLFVQGDSATLHMGAVQTAASDRRGATMAVQSLAGFATASIGPLAVGLALDLSGGGQSVGSWGIAFASMGLVVALGPVFLAALGRSRE